MHAKLGCRPCVRVISISHCTLISRKTPGVGHPTTIAATAAVRGAEFSNVVRSVGCAVNRLLLGETHRRDERACSGGILDCHHSFQSAKRSKSPARAASALVLNGMHMARVCPVDVSGLELTTSVFVCIQCHVVENPAFGGVDGLKTKQSGILAIVEVGGLVNIKFGPSACFVQRLDLLASVTPVTFALAELLSILVLLIVLGCELHEFLVFFGCGCF